MVGELAGFKKIVREGVIVDVNTTVRVDLKLEVGAVQESITVSGESPMLQTDRSDTGRLIEAKMVADLPLTFNRNFQSLLVTVPGATRPQRNHSAFFNSQDSLSTEVNGQSRLANNTMIEGVDDNHKTGLLQVIIPAADALESVSVTTSNYDAEFGRSGGAITNVTLKSGTNTLKGTGFFFGNNEKTNAGDYFSHLKAPTKFVNAGFTLGGPIVRNKVFFFGDYQRTIDNAGYIVRTTRADRGDAQRRLQRGDAAHLRSADRRHRRQPTACRSPTTRSRRIASARSRSGCSRSSRCRTSPAQPLGQVNFQQAQTREKTTDGFDAKVNYTINDQDQMSARVSFMRPVVFDPGLFGEYGGPANGGFAGTGTNTSYSTAATWTRVVSKSTVLDVRGGLNYYRNITSTTGNGLTTSSDVGIPGANLDEYTSGLSNISIGGYGDPLLGFSASQPWDRWERTWNVVGSVTKLLNRHTVKFGGEWRKNTDMLLQTQDAGGPRGRFAFNANGTGNPAEQASLSGLANPLASFLLDWPSTVQRDLKVIDKPGTRALGDGLVHPGQVAGAVERHRRPRAALGVLLAARRDRRPGVAGQLQPGDQPTRGVGLRQHLECPQREELLQELRPAHRHSVAAQRADGRPRRVRGEHDSLSRQPLRLRLPGQAELPGHGGEQLPAAGIDGGRLPGARPREHPGRRVDHADRCAAQLDLRRHPRGTP